MAAEVTPNTNPETPNEVSAEGKIILTAEELQKKIQSEADRVATHHFKEKEALKLELDNLRKRQMSEEELKKFERKQLEEKLTQKERELNDKEISIKARDLLTSVNLPLTFVPFVKGETVEETELRIKSFSDEWQKAISAAVDSKFKAEGRSPAKEREGSLSAGFEGMTPKQIQEKARTDRDWFRKNEAAILQAYANGTLKR